MNHNQSYLYRTMGKDGQVVEFRYPRNRAELDNLLSSCPNIPYVALAVLTPFEPPRDGSGGPNKQYPTGWALAHIKRLFAQSDKQDFITNLRLLHEYIISGGEVRNPIGLFTFRVRQSAPIG